MFDRDGGRQVIARPRRYRDVLGERTVPSELVTRHAHHFAPLAQVDPTDVAEPARAAADRRVERHSIAHGEPGDVVADPLDDSGCLVAHHERRNASSGAPVESVDVAATDAARADADDDLVAAWIGLGHVDEFEVSVVTEQQGSHAIGLARLDGE